MSERVADIAGAPASASATSPAASRDAVAISVVIPTYNRARRLRDCLGSVFDARLDATEVIVVDDGSTDETRVMLRATEAPVTYLRQENRGPSAARNTGIRAASGRYVAFLDSDDRMLPATHARLAACLDRHPDVAVAFADVLVNRPDGAYERSFRREYMQRFWALPHTIAADGARLFEPAAFFRSILLDRCYVVMGAVLVRRSALDAAGLFDERRAGYEEWDLFARLASRYPFAYVDEPAAVIEKHESNFSADEDVMMLQGVEILETYLQGGLPLSTDLQQAVRAKQDGMAFGAAYQAFEREDYPIARRRLAAYMKRWGVTPSAVGFWCATWLPPGQVRRLRRLSRLRGRTG